MEDLGGERGESFLGVCFCWFDLKCVAPGPRGTGIPSLRVTDHLHPPFPGTGGIPEHGTFILKPG